MTRPGEPPGPAAPASATHGGTAQRGSIGLWLLGVCVMLLFLGGIGLDLWRGLAERRALAAVADAAAVAAAQALDAEHFRATGEIMLDTSLARELALASVASQPEARSLTGALVDAGPQGVTVTLTGEVPLTLLAILVPDRTIPLAVRSTAVPAAPVNGP